MRSKTILSAVAFISAFLFSSVFAGLFATETQTAIYAVPDSEYQSTSCFKYKNNSATAVKITALVNQDKRNGLESERVVYESNDEKISPFSGSSFPDYVVAVKQYVNASSSMKSDDLPNDFQTAWSEHMKAWHDYSEFLNRMKNSSNLQAWSEEEYENADDFHEREISRTWYKVLQIGRTYGAKVYQD